MKRVAHTRSDGVIDALMATRPMVKKGRMPSELRARWPDDEELNECAGFIPDAYEFHEDLRTLTIIEVFDTNPIDRLKASRIADLSFALDDRDWQLTVAVFDTAGGLLGEVPGAFFDAAHLRDGNGRNVFPDALAAFVSAIDRAA